MPNSTPDDNSDKNITNKPHTRFGPNALQGINTKLLSPWANPDFGTNSRDKG